jgi:hypothetical protein
MSLKLINKLSEKERKSLKSGVYEVTGKAMNRTALGVVDALTTLFPKATFEELKEMLPDTLNPSAPINYKSLFKPYSDRDYGVIQPLSIRKECEEQGFDINASHFTEKEEIFKSADGIEFIVSRSWESKDTETGENDIQNLIDHVTQYGVRVVQVERKEAFNKGHYNLELINNDLKTLIEKKSEESKLQWWMILLFIVVAVCLYFIATKK